MESLSALSPLVSTKMKVLTGLSKSLESTVAYRWPRKKITFQEVLSYIKLFPPQIGGSTLKYPSFFTMKYLYLSKFSRPPSAAALDLKNGITVHFACFLHHYTSGSSAVTRGTARNSIRSNHWTEARRRRFFLGFQMRFR